MNKNHWIRLICILTIYVLVLFFLKNHIFHYRFNNNIINRLYLSQAIPHEVNGKRIFLSDDDVYLSTGYLYAKGDDPSYLNFEHPPLIKYLFGFSVRWFSNPYIIQIIFGCTIIAGLYYIGLKFFKHPMIPILSTLLLIIDPLFLDLSSRLLLDLGLTAFMILYFITSLSNKDSYFLPGLILALFAGSKFLSTAMFFVLIINGYKIYTKKFQFKPFLLHLIVAACFYCLFYTQSFIIHHGQFNIVWHLLKTCKYWFVHNTTSFFGASTVLYLTNYYQSWWGNFNILRGSIWSILWPISFFISLIIVKDVIIKRKITMIQFIGIIPILYFIYLGIQIPFTRYFILILPFSYLTLSNIIYKFINKIS